MSDPRFDGSLDAPTFVDRGACVDCGQPEGGFAHDERNPDGHFYNTVGPLLAPVRDVAAEPPAIAKPPTPRPEPSQPIIVAPLPQRRVGEKADAQSSANSSLLAALRALRDEEEQLDEQLCALNRRRRFVINAFYSIRDLLRSREVDISEFGPPSEPARFVSSFPAAQHTAQKVHMRSSHDQPRCRVFRDARFTLRLTSDSAEVTCLSCTRMIESDADGGLTEEV